MWGGGHSNCNASLSQSNVQKNNRALVRRGGGGGGGLKLEKINAGITIKSTPSSPHLRKIGHRFPCILYFCIQPQPNNSSLGTGALFLISLSLVGEGWDTAITY